MFYLKDHGFVIRRINFGDSDRYITLFTRDHGKIEVVAKGVRKITSKRSGNVELLNLISFQTVRSSKNLILTEVQLVNSFDELKRELQYIGKVFLMCEIIDAALAPGVPHADVFNLMGRALAHVKKDAETLTYFQAKLLSMLGFWDQNKSFKNAAHVRAVTEEVIERKLRTHAVFGI